MIAVQEPLDFTTFRHEHIVCMPIGLLASKIGYIIRTVCRDTSDYEMDSNLLTVSKVLIQVLSYQQVKMVSQAAVFSITSQTLSELIRLIYEVLCKTISVMSTFDNELKNGVLYFTNLCIVNLIRKYNSDMLVIDCSTFTKTSKDDVLIIGKDHSLYNTYKKASAKLELFSELVRECCKEEQGIRSEYANIYSNYNLINEGVFIGSISSHYILCQCFYLSKWSEEVDLREMISRVPSLQFDDVSNQIIQETDDSNVILKANRIKDNKESSFYILLIDDLLKVQIGLLVVTIFNKQAVKPIPKTSVMISNIFQFLLKKANNSYTKSHHHNPIDKLLSSTEVFHAISEIVYIWDSLFSKRDDTKSLLSESCLSLMEVYRNDYNGYNTKQAVLQERPNHHPFVIEDSNVNNNMVMRLQSIDSKIVEFDNLTLQNKVTNNKDRDDYQLNENVFGSGPRHQSNNNNSQTSGNYNISTVDVPNYNYFDSQSSAISTISDKSLQTAGLINKTVLEEVDKVNNLAITINKEYHKLISVIPTNLSNNFDVDEHIEYLLRTTTSIIELSSRISSKVSTLKANSSLIKAVRNNLDKSTQ